MLLYRQILDFHKKIKEPYYKFIEIYSREGNRLLKPCVLNTFWWSIERFKWSCFQSLILSMICLCQFRVNMGGGFVCIFINLSCIGMQVFYPRPIWNIVIKIMSKRGKHSQAKSYRWPGCLVIKPSRTFLWLVPFTLQVPFRHQAWNLRDKNIVRISIENGTKHASISDKIGVKYVENNNY